MKTTIRVSIASHLLSIVNDLRLRNLPIFHCAEVVMNIYYFGFGKGYALIEYESFEEAEKAISAMDGAELLTQIINVDWAFSRGPIRRKNTRYACFFKIHSIFARGIITVYITFSSNLTADLHENDVRGAQGGDIDLEV